MGKAKKARKVQPHVYERVILSELEVRKNNRRLSTYMSSHSQFIYGEPVETCGPYPHDYMSEIYFV